MNYISVCSGIEAASVAWHPLGWNCLGVSEIEPFPSAVLAHHYSSVSNFGDMTKFQEWKIDGTVNLLVAGTPCQSFSVCGLRQGLKDPRGNLTMSYLGLVENFKPKWIVFENVPGLLSSNGGKDFGSFLGGLGELGYGFAYRVLDAQWCRTHRHPRAVPQRRRRVFVVGCAGDHISAAKVLFERESLQRYSAPRRATRQETAVDVEASVATCWWDGENTASTLTKSNANGAQRMPDKDNFGAVLQPVAIPIMPQAMQSEGWRVGKENQDGRGNGLGVGKDGDPCPTLDRSAVPAIAYSIREDAINNTFSATPTDVGLTVNSLRPSPQSHHAQLFIAQTAPEITAFQSSELRLRGTLTNQDVSPTLLSETKMGDTELRVLSSAPIGCFKSGQGAKSRSIGYSETVSPTLPSNAGGNTAPSLVQTMQVRRLTPTECERLQGFPDGWTKIPWKNKSADECPDGPRYKALGNSMAVNCMEWLGERIQAVESGTL